MASKPGSSDAAEKNNFRMRRLSVSDQAKDDAAQAAASSPAPGQGRRQRRISMSPEMGEKPKAPEVLPFPLTTVGTYSCHGVEPGTRTGETNAKINQDRGSVVYPFGEATPGYERALFIVMDGHGANGDKVSEYTVRTVREQLEQFDNEKGPLLKDFDLISKGLKEAFTNTDASLRKDQTIDAELSGTTAVACLCVCEKGTGKMMIYSANAGDSRAVMLAGDGKTCDLTEDQKPDTPEEKQRIKKAGGFVSPPEEEWGGPARVWLDASMTLPGLAMARSLGDHLVKSIGVIAEPVVTFKQVDLCKDQFLVMASDGVWEFIESGSATSLVAQHIKSNGATFACQKLIEVAAGKWREEEGDYRDDITAICVKFGDLSW